MKKWAQSSSVKTLLSAHLRKKKKTNVINTVHQYLVL
jgi:hypothetical protein